MANKRPVRKKLPLKEFEELYAARLGMSVAEMHKLGLRAVPCLRCNDIPQSSCSGWQITSMNSKL